MSQGEQGGAAAWELWLQPELCRESAALQEVLWLWWAEQGQCCKEDR